MTKTSFEYQNDKSRSSSLYNTTSFYPLTALALAACGGGGGGGSSPTPEPPTPTPTEPLTGRVFDGPVSGAQVYFDVNANGVQDEGDVLVDTTDALGNFTISGTDLDEHGADTPLLVVLDGATDIGNDLTDASDDITLTSGTWQAPVGSTIISPLTDFLVRAEIDNARVVELLELPSDVDVTQYDPYDGDTRNDRDEAVIAAAREVARALAELDTTDPEVTPADIFYTVESSLSEPPTAFMLNSVVDTLAEGTAISTRRKVADLVVEDADTDSADHRYSLSGDDAALFEVIGAELFLKAGTVLDFETNSSLDITVTVAGTRPPLTQTYTLTVTDVAEAPVIEVSGSQILKLEEVTTSAEVATGYTVLATDEDGDDTLTVAITRTDSEGNSVTDNRFLIGANGSLNIMSGSKFDFETEPSITLTITATDDSATPKTATARVTILITNIQTTPVLAVEGPQRVILEGTTGGKSDTGITVRATDEDGNDTVTFTITGAGGGVDDRFLIESGKLRINANAEFDFETEPRIILTITATDDSTPNPKTATAQVTIDITNVNYNPGVLGTINVGTTNVGTTDSTPVFGDVDGDGDMDVLIGRSGGGLNFIRRGTATDGPDGVNTAADSGKTWTDQTTALTGPIEALGSDFGNNSAPAFGDIDGDGDTDVLIGFRAVDASAEDLTWALRGTAWVAKPAGTPTDDTYSALYADTDTDNRPKPAFGDVDGDGDDDLVVGTSDGKLLFFRRGTATDGPDGANTAADSTKSWSQQTGPANPYGQGIALAEGSTTLTKLAPAFGDVDGDGNDDLLLGRGDGRLSYYLSITTGTGLRYVPTNDGLFSTGYDFGDNSAPAFGDVNGDGHDDLLVGEGDGVINIRYWIPNEDGTDGGTWESTIDII